MQKDKSRAWLSFIEMLEQCIVFLAAIYIFYFGLFKMDNIAILYGLPQENGSKKYNYLFFLIYLYLLLHIFFH